MLQVDASVYWDMSPEVNITQRITASDAQVWVDKYATLLRLAHASIVHNLAGLPIMLYVR